MGFDKIIKIKVSGRNVDRYIKRMVKNNINFIKVNKININEVDIVIRYEDYLELLKYNSVMYEIKIVEKLGILSFIDKLKINRVLIIFLMLGLVFLYSLSNVIFSVEVIHGNSDIRKLLYEELDKYGIYKYSFKKGYKELEEIEDEILENNKDMLEWLEIVVDGVFVKVRVEERIIDDGNSEFRYQNIVSSKNAVIKEVKAVSGEVVKEKGSYVKMGDVVISGAIVHPDNSSVLTMASGKVYGEVWYLVKIKYPFVYQESNLTGRKNSGISIKFFNKEFNLFNNGHYKSFSRKNKFLFGDNLLDLGVVFEKRYELDIRDEVYTVELVEKGAISYINDRMIKDNSKIKEISSVRVLSREVLYDGVNFELFVTTLEDIGEVRVIQEDGANNELVN